MRRIILVFGIGLAITLMRIPEALCGRRSDAQQFQVEQYAKAIIRDGTLYISDGQGIRSPHLGSLIVISLTGDGTPQKFPAYTGIYVEDWSEIERKPVPIGAQFQFCWDIADGNVIFIDIVETWSEQKPTFTLVEIPLKWLTASTSLREKYPLRTYGISGLFPLYNHFSLAPLEQRSRVFFDIVTVDESYYLYISYKGTVTVWCFDEGVSESVRMHWKEMSGKEKLQAWKKEWQQISTFPIDFEGPFRVIQLQEKTYIFSEHVRTLYLLEEERLTPLMTLPPLPEGESAGPLDNVFVVDKDHDQAVFFVPSQQHPEHPGVITIGDTSALPQGAESALRSALKLYHESKE